jgi:hypothetical protein
MPAIASLEDLKAAQKDLRSMFLAVFALQLAPYDLRFTAVNLLYAPCALRGSVRLALDGI